MDGDEQRTSQFRAQVRFGLGKLVNNLLKQPRLLGEGFYLQVENCGEGNLQVVQVSF